jgi:hypothetical protein
MPYHRDDKLRGCISGGGGDGEDTKDVGMLACWPANVAHSSPDFKQIIINDLERRKTVINPLRLSLFPFQRSLNGSVYGRP